MAAGGKTKARLGRPRSWRAVKWPNTAAAALRPSDARRFCFWSRTHKILTRQGGLRCCTRPFVPAERGAAGVLPLWAAAPPSSLMKRPKVRMHGVPGQFARDPAPRACAPCAPSCAEPFFFFFSASCARDLTITRSARCTAQGRQEAPRVRGEVAASRRRRKVRFLCIPPLVRLWLTGTAAARAPL